MEKRVFLKLIAFAAVSTFLYPVSSFAKKRKSPGHMGGYGYGGYGYGFYGYGYGYGYGTYGYGYDSYSYGYGRRHKSFLKNRRQDDVHRHDEDPVAQ